MNPEIAQMQRDIRELRNIIFQLVKTDRYIFEKGVQFLDGRNIQLGVATGTKIGTASTQKLAVYGETPVAQQVGISAPSGGGTQDLEARTAINSVITAI